MRYDPITTLYQCLGLMPLRVLLVWFVGSLGAWTPLLLHRGFSAWQELFMWLVLYPFLLALHAISSGWWSLFAIPLFLILSWRIVVFLREEGSTNDVLWLYLLPFLIGLKQSREEWILAIIITSLVVYSRFGKQVSNH